MDRVAPSRPDFIVEHLETSFGVVERPLTLWQKIGELSLVSQGCDPRRRSRWAGSCTRPASTIRSCCPPSRRPSDAFVKSIASGRTARAHRLLDRGTADRLRGGTCARRGADRTGRHHAPGARPARAAVGDAEPDAGDRASAPGDDLVRPRPRQLRLRTHSFGAVGRGAQHQRRIPLGSQRTAHGGCELRPARPALHRADSRACRLPQHPHRACASAGHSPGARSSPRSWCSA